MNQAMLAADCRRCAALCCIALAFDRSDMFAFDKPAGEPCRNLTGNMRCTIHAALGARGFGGCVAFDCQGAGQRVTQELFGGRTWRDDPAVAGPMFDAFRAMRLVHELWSLLSASAQLPLTDEQESDRRALQATLEPDRWTVESLASFERSDTPETIRAFLRSLRGRLADERDPTIAALTAPVSAAAL